MSEAELLGFSPAMRREIWCTFCRAYILSRGNASAQDANLKVLDGLARLWELSEWQQEEWHRAVARSIEATKSSIDEILNRKRYL